MIKVDFELNRIVLDEEKQIKGLTDKCGCEEIARFLHECNRCNHIQWIQFDEFKNIEYLAKGGFGEVHKATWINDHEDEKVVVLKKLFKSSNKILDILKEVKKNFNN